MQYVEGSKKSIENLMNIIQNDPRHENIKILRDGYTEKRQFGDCYFR